MLKRALIQIGGCALLASYFATMEPQAVFAQNSFSVGGMRLGETISLAVIQNADRATSLQILIGVSLPATSEIHAEHLSKERRYFDLSTDALSI